MSYENLTKAQLIQQLKALAARPNAADTTERLRAILETAVEGIITIDERGIGLRIMQYRADMIGGNLTAERDPAGGTIVRCIVPAHSQ